MTVPVTGMAPCEVDRPLFSKNDWLITKRLSSTMPAGQSIETEDAMWFKNLQIYRFTRPFDLPVEQLEPQLEACAFTPCGSQDISRFGWVKPLGKFGSTLTHSASGHILI